VTTNYTRHDPLWARAVPVFGPSFPKPHYDGHDERPSGRVGVGEASREIHDRNVRPSCRSQVGPDERGVTRSARVAHGNDELERRLGNQKAGKDGKDGSCETIHHSAAWGRDR
jgi:hypothetical protein